MHRNKLHWSVGRKGLQHEGVEAMVKCQTYFAGGSALNVMQCTIVNILTCFDVVSYKQSGQMFAAVQLLVPVVTVVT